MENLRRESNQSGNTNYQPERQSSGRNSTSGASTDLPGFEPGSEAPEAPVISKLHYRSCYRFGYQHGNQYVFYLLGY